MKTLILIAAVTWTGLWFTPDQQGHRLFEEGEFVEAAKTFQDPMWQGRAWYRAGEFEESAKAFARVDTAEAKFNQGNAWMMRGKYDTAVTIFDQALEKKPDWQEAIENRDLAAARAKLIEQKGGDLGDQQLGADKMVFDKNAKNNEGQDTQVDGGEALSNQQIQALWLRRVQTKPADFLKAKFSYQQDNQTEGGEQ